MGVSTRRVAQLVATLKEFELVSWADAGGARRLALSDRGWRCWPAGTARQLERRGGAGASRPRTPARRWTGETFPVRAAASCFATSSTPPPFTGS